MIREGEGWSMLNLAELDTKLGQLDGVADRSARPSDPRGDMAGRGWVCGGRCHARAGRVGRAALGRGGTAALDKALPRHARRATTGSGGDRAPPCTTSPSRAVAVERARFDEAPRWSPRPRTPARGVARRQAARRAWPARNLGRHERARWPPRGHARRKAHALEALALALAVGLDAFAGQPEALATRRTALVAMVDQLEAIEPRVEVLRALSRADTGARAGELATRATSLAREHGFVWLARRAR